MTVALYMDHHVPKAITEGLRLRGIDVLTAAEDGRDQTPDSQILDRATDLKRIVYTQDLDFVVEANERLRNQVSFYGVAYSRQLNLSFGEIIGNLEMISLVHDCDEVVNTIFFLPL
ncbi:MAG: DUF5615 family PIN-like protein [Planctomycetota bacterium]|nr:DUF5615 family PIN-like protein [Planctomycetota bacterium]MDA1214566.1 DUF5615 family PIN-like protein [Planctomycetota bacterium]